MSENLPSGPDLSALDAQPCSGATIGEAICAAVLAKCGVTVDP